MEGISVSDLKRMLLKNKLQLIRVGLRGHISADRQFKDKLFILKQ